MTEAGWTRKWVAQQAAQDEKEVGDANTKG